MKEELSEYSKVKIYDKFLLVAKIIDDMNVLEIEELLRQIKATLKQHSIYSICNRPNIGTKEEYLERTKDKPKLTLTYL